MTLHLRATKRSRILAKISLEKNIFRKIISLPILLLFLSCGTLPEPRTYIEHIPQGLNPGAPLMIVLHGYTGSSSSVQSISGMNQMADKYGFGVIYPQGTKDRFGKRHWNADLKLSEVDDVAFLTALRDQKIKEYGFDPNRVFVCGKSNGGFMAYTLACRVPEKFAAVASVIGTMSGETWARRNESLAPMPVLQISGVQDTVVGVYGKMKTSYGWGGAPSVLEIIEYWAKKNMAFPITTVKMNQNVTVHIASNPETHNDVKYYEVHNLDHSWPDIQKHNINATQLIWDFFSSVTQED